MLTTTQREQYDSEGFCRLPGLLPDPVLQRLRKFFEPLLVVDRVPHKAIAATSAGRFVTNIDSIFAWGDPTPLELLALPELMTVAASICGDELFVAQEFCVIKNRGDETPVLWHQDMVNGRSGPCMTMGIYLDDADPDDGALRFVPGSHLLDEPICALARRPAVEVPAKAGDVIIHDMMVAHSSEPMAGNAIRRVIYLEIHSAELAQKEMIYPPAHVENRRRLMFAARRYRRETFPAGNCYKPRQREPRPADRKLPVHQVIRDVYAEPARNPPSNYCLERIPANLGA